MRFLNNGDGTVTDTTTGLMWVNDLVALYESWRRFDNPACDFTFEEASGFCRRLQFAGFSDWRMPTREESFTLTDSKRSGPAIDGEIFPQTGCEDYWTGTEHAINPSLAWVVGFWDGALRLKRKDEHALVRPVRAMLPAKSEK